MPNCRCSLKVALLSLAGGIFKVFISKSCNALFILVSVKFVDNNSSFLFLVNIRNIVLCSLIVSSILTVAKVVYICDWSI